MSGTESFLRPSLRLRNCLRNDVECKLGQARASHRAEGFVLSLASHMVQDGFDEGVGFRSASDTVYSDARGGVTLKIPASPRRLQELSLIHI